MKLIKRLDRKGFAHLEILLIVLVVIIVAVAGIAVYKYHKNPNVGTASTSSSQSTISKLPAMIGKTTKFVSTTPTHPAGIKLPEASANNWSYVTQMGYGSVNVYACKTYIPVYGGVYKIQALYTKPASWTVQAYISSPGQVNYINPVSTNLWWYNVASSLTTYYSIPLGAQWPMSGGVGNTGYVNIGVTGLYGTGAYWEGNPGYLVDC